MWLWEGLRNPSTPLADPVPVQQALCLRQSYYGGEANRLVTFLNQGGGHFRTVFTPVDVQSDVTGRIRVANFNTGAPPDIISGGMLLLGNGDGTFRTTRSEERRVGK